jgi:glycosyltransferase involved in cell wall biosynthesis
MPSVATTATQLVVTAYTPSVSTGRGLRTYAIVRALASRTPVELVYVETDGSRPDARYDNLDGVLLTPVQSSRGLRRGFRYAQALAAGVPDRYARGISAELVAAVRARLGDGTSVRLFADGPIARAAVARADRRVPVAYIAHNVESSSWESIGGWSRRTLARIRGFEGGLLNASAECWMATDADLALAARMAPSARLRYVPNAIDVNAIVPVDRQSGEEAVLFVGDFTYDPNQQAVDFLLESVMPRVWAARPAARLLLVGRGLPPVSRDARVEALGYVPDLRAIYERARCAVAPLVSGGGSPFKFLEAMAYGVPVVATSRAAAGLRATPGEHYHPADTAQDLGAAVSGQLAQPDAAIVANARRLVEREYSIERLCELLAADD